ncbi:MAG: DUF1800 family protein [Deltaproteobacteria bacterium]|nr:DUF1800 family protein [Deltaproteobacteria bacterium]
MKVNKVFFAMVVACVFFTSSPVLAAKKAKKLTETTGAVKVEAAFNMQNANGAFDCGGPIKNKYYAGTFLKSSKFLSFKQRLSNIKKLMKTASGKKLTKYKKAKSKYAKLNKAAKGACDAGPNVANPTPTPPTVNPAVKLAKLSRPLTAQDINHLYKKAGLGYVPPEMMQHGLANGVDALVDTFMTFTNEPDVDAEAATWLYEKNENSTNTTETGVKLWAFANMYETKSNAFHKHLCFAVMHDIIATSVRVVNQDPARRNLMVKHFNTLCQITTHGSWRQMIYDITKDPVMLIWLDGNTNHKDRPNENYAREELELFTVGSLNRAGEPNYTDLDIAQSARANTGFNVLLTQTDGWSATFNFNAFDSAGDKVLFAGTPYQTTVTNWEDVIAAIFEKHPNTAHNIALMLAQRYTREDIDHVDPELVDALAAVLKENNFNILPMLNALFKSEWFYSDANRTTYYRRPIELAVHFGRAMRAQGMPINMRDLFNAAVAGGQEIANPETVFGVDTDELAHGQRFLDFNNRVTTILTNNQFNTETNASNWNYRMLLPPGNPNPDSAAVIDRVAEILGLDLPAVARAGLRDIMENQMRQTGTPPTFTLVPDPWNPADYNQVRRKVVALLRVMIGTRQFRLS